MIYLLMILFTALSIAFDYWIIEKKKIEIKQWGHYLRGLIHILVLGGLACLDWRPTLESGAILGICFWFLFDTGLNKARNQPIDHLGNALIDRIQKKLLPTEVVFIFKALLFVGLTACYFGNY